MFDLLENDRDEFLKRLDEHVKAGNVREVRHSHVPFMLYNYAPCVQYDRMWDDVTMRTRGLVLDRDGEIVANPFPKFFNLSEHDPDAIPDEPFEVFDKADGSLGITYFIGMIPYIATRGSFTSEQAQRATKILHHRYVNDAAKMDPTLTYLFEIIYPGNRIVVDYGSDEKLVLLGARETMTGEEIPLADIEWSGPRIQQYDHADLWSLSEHERENAEGYVVRFASGFRVKVKHAEYLRLHKLLTCTTARTIWEELRAGRDLGQVLDAVPDEFMHWVQSTAGRLTDEYDRIENRCREIFARRPMGDRKQVAIYFQGFSREVPTAVLFSMLDGKSYREIIWRELRPEHEVPFAMAESV